MRALLADGRRRLEHERGTGSAAWSASHNAVFPPNDVPSRLNGSSPRRSIAAPIVPASSGMVRVRVFSGDGPKPGISNAITRKRRASKSCAGPTASPPAP